MMDRAKWYALTLQSVVLAAVCAFWVGVFMLCCGEAHAACPDFTAPPTKQLVQFPGPCPAVRPLLHVVVDVGVAVENVGKASPGVPHQLRPDECAWVPRRWVGCLRSRCVGSTADVEPGTFTSPRGGNPVTTLVCPQTWGTP
jgi:hypothetical protein